MEPVAASSGQTKAKERRKGGGASGGKRGVTRGGAKSVTRDQVLEMLRERQTGGLDAQGMAAVVAATGAYAAAFLSASACLKLKSVANEIAASILKECWMR